MAAGVAMLKEIRKTLLDSPKTRDQCKLSEFARPTPIKMAQLRPSFSKEFESHLSIKHSFLNIKQSGFICRTDGAPRN